MNGNKLVIWGRQMLLSSGADGTGWRPGAGNEVLSSNASDPTQRDGNDGFVHWRLDNRGLFWCITVHPVPKSPHPASPALPAPQPWGWGRRTAAGPRMDVGYTQMLHSWCPCSLLLPYPGVSFSAASAMPRCYHRRFLCKNGCLVCSWLLLTTCREHACPAVGKTACYQQMAEDGWEGWWKVTGYGQNASTSIARRNTISLPAVTIE